MNKAICAGGVIVKIVDNAPKILLVYFRDDPYRGNAAFPKGHLEEGESEEQAAMREVVEETGLQNPRIVRKLGIVSRLSKEDSGETVFKDIYLFLMQIDSFVHAKAEERYGWFSYEEALEKLSFQEEKDFLKKIWPEIEK
ncbi:MAG: NUDIX domain-containing protein [bacterium]|nr:NUDIX domain-containing protein [bacterium]